MYVHNSFSTMLDKVVKKNIKNEKKEMEKLENINEMGAPN